MTARLRLPILCLVTDTALAGSDRRMIEIVRSAVEGGVTMVQVREKSRSPRELAAFAQLIVDAVGDGAEVVVNGDLEAAVSAHAAGIHLPEKMLSDGALVERAHEHGLLAGASVHSAAAMTRVASLHADYGFMGTMFPSRSHPGGPTCGVDGLREAVRAANGMPVVAIGGIDAGNAREAMNVGAAGIAVIGAIISDSDPRVAAERLAVVVGPASPLDSQ